MKRKLALLLAASCLIGSVSVGPIVSAEGLTPVPAQHKSKPKPQTPGFNTESNSTKPGKIIVTPAVLISCMPGYSKVGEHKTAGAVDVMKCQSPVYECPHKSKIKRSNGSDANGQGIEIKKIPVGAGDSNRFKIEYTCTYYWAMG
ncbi:hypothetical protein [Pelagibius sp. Alg239-R121]|uniref:hypothetical protein n=1 Tax=Pelagibius sp. Alg239-R121 TaxID=2993448 RepID=UPI0024A65809|nr:hypothetical protein [Pelagibius sp. Alg239-R121]